jgi:hypothetical protein
VRDYLLQIKAVPGVKGCAVLDLGRREMHPLLPATATPEFAEKLAERLSRLADQLQPGEQVEFRFEKQACLVRRLVRGVLYVQGKAGFDVPALQLALRASSSAMDRLLKSAQSQRSLSYDFTNPEYLTSVLKAFSLCADHFKEHLGHTLVAKKMQKAKENVASLFPLVNELVVDQNGRVYPLKGRHLELDVNANEAFARWLSGFITLASASRPELAHFNLRDLTQEVAGPLDDSNFYGTFKAV